MWKNTVEPGMAQITTLCMRIICCVPKSTDTLSKYVNLNIFFFFKLQQWLRGSTSMLRLPPLPAL